MGLFGKLFEKKTCDICGGEIGLLGNRKLEDGNCCKECAGKLSPWFSGRKHSTVAEIKEQLAYREKNQEAVDSFQVTRTFGEDMKVLVDEKAYKFMVTRARNLHEANPDVLDFSQVTACEIDIRESKDEVFREVKDAEGNKKEESYSPRRYKFSYDFMMIIRVNHPYFDDMEFSLSDGSVDVKVRNVMQGSFLGIGFTATNGTLSESSPTPPTQEDKQNCEEYVRYEKMAQEIQAMLLRKPVGTVNSKFAPLIDAYVKAVQVERQGSLNGMPGGNAVAHSTCESMRAALLAAAKEDPEGAAEAHVMDILAADPATLAGGSMPGAQPQAEQPKSTVTCPWCGAQTTAGKFCENCGGSLQG